MSVDTVRLMLRSAWFYRRAHGGLLLGTAVASAVLTGALLVGDSVRDSLRRQALSRLGRTTLALQTPNRSFDSGLAPRLQERLGVPVVPVLQMRGMVMLPSAGGRRGAQVNRVQVLGVDERFWSFADGAVPPLSGDEIALNAKLAQTLGAAVGDEVALRVERPSLLPGDAPLAEQRDGLAKRGTFRVARIVPDDQLGRFSLAASQIAPPNAFVSLARLQELIGQDSRANTLLAGERPGAPLTVEQADACLRAVWQIEDAGLHLRPYADGAVAQLESDRVFLDPAVSAAATGSVGALAYLANSMRTEKGRMTPYSFLVATAPCEDAALSHIPPAMSDDEIVINQWVADNLEVGPGDRLEVAYSALTVGNRFEERTRAFRVRAVLGMDALAREKAMMPKFPGLTDVERCSDWNVGLPMRDDWLTDKGNESYWTSYGATPKAFVTLRAGQAMWANRFGDLSGARIVLAGRSLDDVRVSLALRIDPGLLGLRFQPVREQALAAASGAVDFGQLFLGMSLFLLVAALVLTGMLFALAVARRREEWGLLLAVGYTPARVRWLILGESGLIALAGAALGLLPGVLYTRALIWGLSALWRGAVAGAAIAFHGRAATLALGFFCTVIAALAAIALAGRSQVRRPARELLAGHSEPEAAGALARRASRVLPVALWIGPALVAILIVAAAQRGGGEAVAPAFFGAGALLLVAGIGFCAWLLRAAQGAGGQPLTLAGLSLRNAARNRARTLTAVAVLSSGCFLVLAVASMKEDVTRGAERRSSGTGGFALVGESTLPLRDRLDDDSGWSKAFAAGPTARYLRPAVVSLKVHDAEDASCLNLNRVSTPRLLGVDAEAFAVRRAFMPDDGKQDLWCLLAHPLPDGAVPGLAGDRNTAMWGLQKRADPLTGDVLEYRDERGVSFRVRLVGALPVSLSVFQGTVLIPDWAFAQRYPSESGYRMFLLDVAPGTADVWRRRFAERFERIGMDLAPAPARLQEYYAVESTYLSMFLVLGGLGLVLGSVGLAIVLARNIEERRAELAMLQAVGYPRHTVRALVAHEHRMLLLVGVACGAAAALVAMWPSLRAPGVMLPWPTIAGLLLGILATGVAGTALGVRLALRAPLVPALRNE